MSMDYQDDIPVLSDILQLGQRAPGYAVAAGNLAGNGDGEIASARFISTDSENLSFTDHPPVPASAPGLSQAEREQFELEVRLAVMNQLQTELGLSLQKHLEQIMDEAINEAIEQTIEQMTASLRSEMQTRLRTTLQAGLQASLYAAIDEAVSADFVPLQDSTAH